MDSDPQQLEQMLAGLRQAGIPEEKLQALFGKLAITFEDYKRTGDVEKTVSQALRDMEEGLGIQLSFIHKKLIASQIRKGLQNTPPR